MNKLLMIFEFVFGCWHRNLSRPFTFSGWTYEVCRWVTSNLQSLCRYERRTRLNESIHLIGFIGFTVLAASKFASGSLTVPGLSFALALNLIFGLWPVVLQRYNRLRLYRAIDKRSYLSDRQLHKAEARWSSSNEN